MAAKKNPLSDKAYELYDLIVTLDHIAKEEPNVSPMLYAGRKEKAETNKTVPRWVF